MNVDVVSQTKTALLCQGVRFDPKIFHGMDGYYENQYVYNNTNPGIVRSHRVPQVLCLDDDTIVALHRRPASPWHLERHEGRLALFRDGHLVQPVELPEKPAYFGKRLSGGQLIDGVIAVAGSRIPGYYVQSYCTYISRGVGCQFCAVNNTRQSVGRDMALRFDRALILESMRVLRDTPWKEIPIMSITSGAFGDNDAGARHQAAIVRTINEVFEHTTPIHLLTIPPDSLDLLYDLRESGVTTIAFNMEVWDPDHFARYCPGKQRDHGYDGYLRALEAARDVFGPYRVFCGLIWGLEPSESILAGYHYLLERGINVSSNVFHADEGTALEHVDHPSAAFVTALAHEQARLARRYQIRSIFPVSMRNTLDYEIVRGDFSVD